MMKYFTRNLGMHKGTATFYLHEPTAEIDIDRKYPVMVVIPGGAYMWTSDRESEPVALEFFAKDYHVLVVNYSTEGLAAYQDEAALPADPTSKFPTPLVELAEAVAVLRENAAEWAVASDQINVLGFSAGGNLAGLLAVYWQESWLEELVNKDKQLYRPDRVILAYAPLDFVGIHFEESSAINLALMGTMTPNLEERKKVSPIYHVSRKTPPMFLWHTGEDPLVSVENSLKMAVALQENNVPYELHIYQKGVHGVSLGDSRTSRKPNQSNEQAASWVELVMGWLV